MSELIKVTVDDQQVRDALKRLTAAARSPDQALRQIGELLVDSTKQRFGRSVAPDGTPWAKNSETTLMRYLGKYTTSFSKRDGRMTSKGAVRAAGKKPLIGETGSLSSQIHYSVDGGVLSVGSSMIYGAVQQFGAKARQFKGKAPWGDIPDRPFLGISDQDSQNILDTISDYLEQSARP